jgi:hypothetical protein
MKKSPCPARLFLTELLPYYLCLQTIIAAGFRLEELGGMRELLDGAGGQGVVLIPCEPSLLGLPTAEALQKTEPDWDRPMPAHWVHGGGWGATRVLALAGLG